MIKNYIVCPRCDEQGLIYNAKVIELGILIKICDECEACWTRDQPVKLSNFKGLTVFLEENGLTYEGSTIEDLGYVEEKHKYLFYLLYQNIFT